MRLRFSKKWIAALAIFCVLSLPTTSRAINTGDIIVADGATGLIFIDHLTGAQHVLSGTVSVGGAYIDVASNSAGEVFALASDGPGSIYKIDTVTGARSLIAAGGHLLYTRTIDLAPDGAFYLAKESLTEGLIRVDPTSGSQTVVAGGFIRAFVPAGVGFGYVALGDAPTPPSYHLYRVDLSSGQLTQVSNTGFENPGGLALDASGNVILTDASFAVPNVSRIDPTTGSATMLNAGPFLTPWGVTVESDGSIIVADHQNAQSCTRPEDHACPGALYRLGAAGGQTLLTEKDLFHDIAGADIYKGPSVPTGVRKSTWTRLKMIYR
jgi:streptogramin lyase